MEHKFLENISIYESVLKKDTKRFQYIGFIKVFLFILFVFGIYQLFTGKFAFSDWIAVLILLILQIFSWLCHNRIHENLSFSKGMIEINQKNISRLNGAWKDFKDWGEEYAQIEHPYGMDLDIVGKKSLFQFLNQTNTRHGRKAFIEALLHQSFRPDEITFRQQAITELAKDFNFMSKLWYHFSKIGSKSNISEFINELKYSRPFFRYKLSGTLLMRLPLITCLLLAGAFLIPIVSPLKPLSVLLVLLQSILWLAGVSRIHYYLTKTAALPFKLNPYHTVIGYIEVQNFQSERLQNIIHTLSASNVSAKKAMRELNQIADRLSARHNSILYFLLNIIFLWDYKCIILMEKWKNTYAPYCEAWLTALGELESLTCFANLPYVCHQVCMPDMIRGKQIQAKDMGHPLISNKERVMNSIQLNNEIFIISGSNMSGKTTFLRTIGINLVLAKCGSYICAKEMKCSLFNIITSMRIADDLNEGISTFYAELKRIKHVIDSAGEEQMTLFLIDEIFRGTNSEDRLCGAKAVLEKLCSYGVSGMITTHDLELCKLETQYANIRNYNFRETYKGHQIIFDYKIRSGKSQTTNGKFLMELLGVI